MRSSVRTETRASPRDSKSHPCCSQLSVVRRKCEGRGRSPREPAPSSVFQQLPLPPSSARGRDRRWVAEDHGGTSWIGPCLSALEGPSHYPGPNFEKAEPTPCSEEKGGASIFHAESPTPSGSSIRTTAPLRANARAGVVIACRVIDVTNLKYSLYNVHMSLKSCSN